MHSLAKKTGLLIVFICCARYGSAQLPTGVSISGYADAYVAYYNDSLPPGAFQKFPTYAPRSSSIGLNIAQLSVAYKSEKARALITLHYGDIPASSWSGTLNMVQEANAGIRLGKRLWLDAGFFRTHIGAEGLYPKENIASSIALVTLYEPYYQAGFKLAYRATPNLEVRLYLLNGYNLFEDNNRKKSLGMLVSYAFSEASSIAYCNYLGDDSPDSADTRHLRCYNNFCFNYDRDMLRITAGLDCSVQQHSGATHLLATGFMIGGLAAVRYTVKKQINIYTRAEYFYDKDGCFAGTYTDIAGSLKTLIIMGGTLGLEFRPLEHAYLRLESRALKAGHDVQPFYWKGSFRDTRYEEIFCMGVWF